MHEVQLSDSVYKKVREAALSERKSVEQYVREAVELRLAEPENLDPLFSPEVLTAIDKGLQDAKEGRTTPIERVMAERAANRTEWRKKHAS
jgi:predicted transcriptional regulator